MGIKNFLKKLGLPGEENQDYDDYDDYGDFDEEEETKKTVKKTVKKSSYANDFEDDDEDDDIYGNPGGKRTESSRPAGNYGAPAAPRVVGNIKNASSGFGSEVCVIAPKSYEDANSIADMLLKNKAVVLNLEGIDMAAAQRIIDFATGSCYTVGGSLQKISKKIFMIVPESMNLSGDFEQVLGNMVDLNGSNMLK